MLNLPQVAKRFFGFIIEMEGFAARLTGSVLGANPYPYGSASRERWMRGWLKYQHQDQPLA